MPVDREKMDDVYEKRKRLSWKYSLDNAGNYFNYRILCSRIESLLKSNYGDLSAVRMLDIGAGPLLWLEEFSRMGIASENCYGADLLLWRLQEGRQAGRSAAAVACSADRLPFTDSSFDLVTQFTMMTSILDKPLKEDIAKEIVRVLKPGGFCLWYDFRLSNPQNRNARGIGRKEICQLFESFDIEMESTTLLPQLARKLIGPTVPLLKFFYRLPILRTHYLALIGPKR